MCNIACRDAFLPSSEPETPRRKVRRQTRTMYQYVAGDEVTPPPDQSASLEPDLPWAAYSGCFGRRSTSHRAFERARPIQGTNNLVMGNPVLTLRP